MKNSLKPTKNPKSKIPNKEEESKEKSNGGVSIMVDVGVTVASSSVAAIVVWNEEEG